MNVGAVRKAIVDALSQRIDPAVNVYAVMPEAPRFPCAFVDPLTITYHETMSDRALAGVTFDVWVGETSRPEDAAELIDAMMSSAGASTFSLVDALEDDPTFGGAVETSWVESGRWVKAGEENAGVFAAAVTLHVYERRGG